MAFNLRERIDYVTKDYEGFRNSMIEQLKVKIPEYSDFSESDMGIVLIELFAHGLDVLSYYTDKVANELYPATARERESIIKHCQRLGYELKNATPSQFRQVFEIVPQDTDTIIPAGTKLTTSGDDIVEFELMENLLIPANKTGLEKDIDEKYLYTALIEHGYSVNNDVLGSSTGQAYQSFYLGYKPVIIDSLQVMVIDGDRNAFWKKVVNFVDSDLDAEVYTIQTSDDEETQISFGSGSSGKIPPYLIDGIIASYRVGGGEIGNVALNTVTKLGNPIAVVKNTYNVEFVINGRDKESLEEARVNAIQSLRVLWRAVTLDDYEVLTMQEFSVQARRVRALLHTDNQTIRIYILPRVGTTVLPELQNDIIDYFEDRKEIGYIISVHDPVIKTVNLTVTATTTKEHYNLDIKNSVTSFITDYLKLGNLDFGESFSSSSLVANLMSLRGVKEINLTSVGGDALADNEILELGTLSVTTTGGIDDGQAV